MNVKVDTFKDGLKRPTLMVASHERSGTHFLMNSLARAFGYPPSDKRLDFDQHSIHINFHSTVSMEQFFAQFEGNQVANILKSHHEAAFFEPVIDKVLAGVKLLYIHRHPQDVMPSLWRLIRNFDWREGPRCDSPAALMRAAPEGQMMRYQMGQHESMLHRWMHHVSGWVDLAEQHQGIHLVRYEDLRDNYTNVMALIGRNVTGVPPMNLTPPDRNVNVVVSQAQDNTQVPWEDADLEYLQSVTAPLLKRLGYV